MENNVAMATDGRKKKCSGISEYSGAYMIVNGVIVCASGAAVVRASRKERRSSREMEKRLRSYSAKSVPEWFRNGQALGAKKLRICPNAARGGLYTVPTRSGCEGNRVFTRAVVLERCGFVSRRESFAWWIGRVAEAESRKTDCVVELESQWSCLFVCLPYLVRYVDREGKVTLFFFSPGSLAGGGIQQTGRARWRSSDEEMMLAGVAIVHG